MGINKASLNKIYRKIKSGLGSKSFLFFINGWICALMFISYSENQYEVQLFNVFASRVSAPSADHQPVSIDSMLVRSLHLTNSLEKDRLPIFVSHNPIGWKAQFIRPVTVDLATGSGACGSYSLVLARLMDQLRVPVRVAQMKVGENKAGHIVVEAHNGKSWVVMDPLFNLMFKRPDGQFASFEDIKSNWAYYRTQVPPNYKQEYDYEGVQYTNWDKIPILMPAIRELLYLTKGKKATDESSFRMLFIRKYYVVFCVCLILFLTLTSYMVWRYIVNRKKNGPGSFGERILEMNFSPNEHLSVPSMGGNTGMAPAG